MNKKILTIILAVIILILAITAILYYLYLPFRSDPNTIIITTWNETGMFSTDKKYPPTGGFDGFLLGGKYEIVQTKFDFFNPIYTLIVERPSQFKEEKKSLAVTTIYFKKTNESKFAVDSYKSNEVMGDWEETINLTKKHDITTDFPNKSDYKITNYKPLTQEEIEANRQRREREKTNAQARQDEEELYLNGTKEQKLQIINQRIELLLELQTKTTLPPQTVINYANLLARYQKEKQDLLFQDN